MHYMVECVIWDTTNVVPEKINLKNANYYMFSLYVISNFVFCWL